MFIRENVNYKERKSGEKPIKKILLFFSTHTKGQREVKWQKGCQCSEVFDACLVVVYNSLTVYVI